MVDTLRVADWKSFIGQHNMKDRLDVHIRAAVAQKRTLEHILLAGPPGFGKTSLSSVIAKRLNAEIVERTMPIDERDFLQMLRKMNGGVLLLDEIHRATKSQQENLLPLLESGWMSDKRGVRHMMNPITIIGATTEPEKVIPPLYDRFSIKPDFDEYTDEEMGEIVTCMAQMAHVKLGPAAAEALGRATGGIPRRARQYVLAARDLTVTGNKNVDANAVLTLCRVDSSGMTQQHQQYLKILEKMNGLAGLKTLQNLLRVNETVVRDLEYLLLKQNLIMFTERGRELTGEGWAKAKLIV